MIQLKQSKAEQGRLLFSVTARDFEMQTFRSGGKGGQNQNKVNSGVRLIHKASGARGEARDSRDQGVNRMSAFHRLLATPKWKAWHKMEIARLLGYVKKAEKIVDEETQPAKLRQEILTPQGWVEVPWSVIVGIA